MAGTEHESKSEAAGAAPSADALAAELGGACPDLAAVVAAWPGLPEAIKAGIVAMVEAAERLSAAAQSGGRAEV